MTTYVLIPPHGRLTAAEMSIGLEAESIQGVAERMQGSGRALRDLLKQVRPANADGVLAISGGVEENPEGVPTGSSFEVHSETVRTRNSPRPLDAVGAVIVDDLDRTQIDELINEDVDVIENFEIVLEAPVAQTSAAQPENWHLSHIAVQAARHQGLYGKGIRIGILDTGIDATHPEFANRSISFMEFDSRGFKISATPHDAGDHGTHVAGIAAGVTCGVAPKADLSVAAVLTHQGQSGKLSGFFAQILAGANWLLQSNFGTPNDLDEVDILNASLGGTGYRPYLYNVLNLAQMVPAVQLIASIGNAGPAFNSHGSPGNYDISIGVGASDRNDQIAPFSSWGRVAAFSGLAKPDLAAPGVDICSAQPGGAYQLMSGTSMASPIVAGAAALLMEKHPRLQRNPAKLRQIIMQHTVPCHPSNRSGRGRLDLSGI